MYYNFTMKRRKWVVSRYQVLYRYIFLLGGIVLFLLGYFVIKNYSGQFSRDVTNAKEIPQALFSPYYVSVTQAQNVFNDNDLFLVTRFSVRTIAFPETVMSTYSIVNDELDGIPFAATFCTVCRTGIIYDRRTGDGRVLTFGDTGELYKNSMVLFDYETRSRWAHTTGVALSGPLIHTKLATLSSTIVTFSQLKKDYPGAWTLIP